MTDATKRESLIELMVRLEESAGAYYKTCARKFPTNSDFWMSLVAAEEQHARFLRDLAAQPAEAVAFAGRRRFAPAALKTLLDSLRQSRYTVETTAVTEVRALTIARDLEGSVLEKKVLEPVPGDPPAVVEMIRRLNSETTNHRVLIERALAALTSGKR